MKITNVNDYVDALHEQYPELTKTEIKRILVYGWKMIIQYVSAGNDVQIKSLNTWLFIGRLRINALKNFENYCRKLARRIGYMFRRTKSEWDGYYYFSRTEKQYQEYLAQNKKTYKVFKNVFLYKLVDELKIKEHIQPYIFRLSEDRTKWMKKYYPEIKTKNAELIEVRDSLKLQDILVTKNKFKYIQQ